MGLCECLPANGKEWRNNMCVDADNPHYAFVYSGKCADSGYALVASQQECDLAARKLRTVDPDSTPDLSAYYKYSSSLPAGCYKYGSGSLYFNKYSSSSVSCSSSRPCLCRTSAFDSGAYSSSTSAGGCIEHITSEAEGKGAAMMLNSNSYYKYDSIWNGEPQGCFMTSSNNVYFNWDTTRAAGYNSRQSICRTSSFYHPDHKWHDTGRRVTCADANKKAPMAAITTAWKPPASWVSATKGVRPSRIILVGATGTVR